VIGDNGQIDWNPTGEINTVQTTDPTLGGDDVVLGGEGDNTVLGGFGNDSVTTGAGRDLVIGDNGVFDYTTNGNGAPILTLGDTTDTTNATGGNDTIATGDGDNVVLAGVGSDTVTTGTGADLVIGDNGPCHGGRPRCDAGLPRAAGGRGAAGDRRRAGGPRRRRGGVRRIIVTPHPQPWPQLEATGMFFQTRRPPSSRWPAAHDGIRLRGIRRPDHP